MIYIDLNYNLSDTHILDRITYNANNGKQITKNLIQLYIKLYGYDSLIEKLHNTSLDYILHMFYDSYPEILEHRVVNYHKVYFKYKDITYILFPRPNITLRAINKFTIYVSNPAHLELPEIVSCISTSHIYLNLNYIDNKYIQFMNAVRRSLTPNKLPIRELYKKYIC